MNGEITLNNGFKIPNIGFGTYPYKEDLSAILPSALSLGHRLYDTSDNYHNEQYVGQILKENEIEYKSNDIIIVTKFSEAITARKFDKHFEKSNEKLNNKINIYLLHWPYPFLYKKLWRKMEKLYMAGKCDAIGVCNFEVKHLEKLLQSCMIPPAINQIECHPLFRQKEICEFCQLNNIVIMSYSPLARMNKTLIENPILVQIAKEYGKTVSQIVLRWNYQHDYISIASSSNAEHIYQNINIFDFSLTKEEMQRIDAIDCGIRIRFDPNKRFSFFEKLLFLKENIFIKLNKHFYD